MTDENIEEDKLRIAQIEVAINVLNAKLKCLDEQYYGLIENSEEPICLTKRYLVLRREVFAQVGELGQIKSRLVCRVAVDEQINKMEE